MKSKAMSRSRERNTHPTSEAETADSANDDTYPSGFGNWLRAKTGWLVPRRGQRLWKTRAVLLVVVGLLAVRAGYVQLRYGAIVRSLKADGYVRDLSEDYPFQEKWHHPTEPQSRIVRIYWFPRPPDSPVGKIDRFFIRQPIASIGIGLHFIFITLARPFVVPIDSRSGFNPHADFEATMQGREQDMRASIEAPRTSPTVTRSP